MTTLLLRILRQSKILFYHPKATKNPHGLSKTKGSCLRLYALWKIMPSKGQQTTWTNSSPTYTMRSSPFSMASRRGHPSRHSPILWLQIARNGLDFSRETNIIAIAAAINMAASLRQETVCCLGVCDQPSMTTWGWASRVWRLIRRLSSLIQIYQNASRTKSRNSV